MNTIVKIDPTVPIIKIEVRPKTSVQIGMASRFPSQLIGGAGVDVTKDNSNYRFDLDFGDFMPPNPTLQPPDAPFMNSLLYNSATGVYQLTPISSFVGLASSALPLMDGVAAVGTHVPYSREDHVHPTDTSRAPLASPVLTGDPRAPTPAPGDNDTSIATTAFVAASIGVAVIPATAAPLMDGAAAVGVGLKYAREDHVHPTDTSRAPVNNPVLTGDPRAPTPGAGDNDTSIATTAFVSTAIVNANVAPPATVAPLMNGVAAVGVSAKYAKEDHIHPTDTSRAPLASPALTGVPTTPNAGGGTNTTQIANTAFVAAAVAPLAPLASPPLTGVPTAPTAGAGTSTTQLATTAFVGAAITAAAVPAPATVAPLMNGVAAVGVSAKYAKEDHVHPTDTSLAPLASPGLTGTPTSPTATAGTNTTQIATTAFVAAAVTAGGGFVEAPIDGTLYGRVNAAWSRGVKLAGDTMTGPLLLSANPTVPLGAATKQYVDSATPAPFPSGTLMLFQQTAAPTGWTKQTTHNDKALRVVSGTASSGGTNTFSSVNAQTAVGNTTLSLGQIPSINPSVDGSQHNTTGGSYINRLNRATTNDTDLFTATISNFGWSPPGGGGAHNHAITMDIQYVDLIIASKN